MKKIIFIIIATLTISTAMFAQIADNNSNLEKQIEIDKQNLKENAQKADLIIIGKVIKTYGFYGNYEDFNNNICTAMIIRVEKVLKGNLQDTLIETYLFGGKVGNIIQRDNHPPAGLKCSNTGIYCLKNSKMIKLDNADTTTNLKMFTNLAAICTNYKKNIETKEIDILTGEYKTLNIVGEDAIFQSLNLPFHKPKSIKKKEQEKLPIQNKSEINKQKFKLIEEKIIQKKQTSVNNQKSSSSTNESCKEPFFSEFLNGSNLNKALEIFNPRTTALNLHGFVLRAGLIGQSTLISVSLDGIIQPKGTYVISNVSADSSILQIANKIVNDSTLLSTVQITLEDSTGRIYDKIGSTELIEWIAISLPFYSTHSFKRDFNISHGDTNWVTAQTSWNAIAQNDFSNIHRHVNVCSPQANSITFEFDNFTVSNSGGNDYAEFDIMATSSTGAYLQNAPFWIGYSNSAFTQNVVANNAITVTRGSTFGSSYEDPQTSIWDSLPNMFIVGITDDFTAGSWNRPFIGTTPIQVLHFKIKIANCNQNVDFNFLEQASSSFVTLGCPTATEDAITGNYYFFDNVFYSNLTNATIPICAINITQINGSFSDIHRIGGDITDPMTTITIQGGHFGNIQGNGKVFMKNANDGGVAWLELDNYDIISWTDNLITVKIPNVKIDNTDLVVGSGKVKVRNNNGDEVISNQNVIVDYSFSSYFEDSTNPQYKNRPNHAAKYGEDHKLFFSINTTTNNTPGLRDCVAKAIKDWRCSTAANWFLDSLTTPVDINSIDSVNTIAIKHFPNDTGIFMVTLAKIEICTQGNVSRGIVRDIDILINPSYLNVFHYDTTFTQDIPTGKYDFYHIILHELGHAMLLGHTNQSTDIMYFSTPPEQLQSERVFYIDYDNLDAGINVVTKSNNSTFNCNLGETIFYETSGNCTGGTSGERYLINNANNTLDIFPNPTNDLLNISYTLSTNSKIQIQLINSLGQIVKEVSNQQTEGTYTLNVDTKPFANGIYFIRFSDGVNTKQAKVIVQ